VASRRGRGQVLVLAALTISLVILSTQAYIYHLSRTGASAGWSALSGYVLSIEQGSRHVVAASLINVSQGGEASSLGGNLDRWEAFVEGDYRFGHCNLNSTVASQTPYVDGVRLDWETDGMGVSSASADFALNLSGRGAEVDWSFNVNITTTAMISGSYVRGEGDIKHVKVILDLLNEGEPALAGIVNLSYHKEGEWRDPAELDSYSQQDFGNGTYRYSFTDTIPEAQVHVRVQAYDRRDVFVQAEADLSEG
jgi:hypothetical protein